MPDGLGAVGLIGNSLGGRMVDRHPLIASMVFCACDRRPGGAGAEHSLNPGLAAAMGIWGVTQAAMFGQPCAADESYPPCPGICRVA